ncbi:MAG: hypothetical protein SchgKO_21520 [Schleiferiaceae bacterium]
MTTTKATRTPWRSALALVLIVLAMWMNWDWIWAILLLLWAIPDITSGTTYLMEPVYKEKSPVLYWAILSVWILTAVYILLAPWLEG